MSYQGAEIGKLVVEVGAEVFRASELHPEHHSLPETLGVIMMELGEVTSAMQARDTLHAEAELLQVAAVCVRGVMASRARRCPTNRHAEGGTPDAGNCC